MRRAATRARARRSCRSRATAARRTSTPCSSRWSRRSRWWPPRRRGWRRSGPRSTPARWSACSAPARSTTAATGRRRPRKRLLQLDHTAIFLLIVGTYTPIALLAIDGTDTVVTLPRCGSSPRPGIVFEWMPVPAPRGYVTAVYMCLGWIGAFAFVPLYESTGWAGVLLIAGGGLCYTIGAIVHAARKPDPVARDLRLPRDLPRVRDRSPRCMHYCAIAVPRAPARRVSDADERPRPRAAQPRVLGRRRRRLPGRARDALARRPRAWGVWRIPDAELGVLGDVARARRARVRLRRRAVVGRPRGRRRAGRRPRPVAGPARATRAPRSLRRRRTPSRSCARAARHVPFADESFDVVFVRPRRHVVLRSRRGRSPRWRACCGPAGGWCSRTRTPWPYLTWTSTQATVSDAGCAAPTSACAASTTVRARAPSTSSSRTASGSGCFRAPRARRRRPHRAAGAEACPHDLRRLRRPLGPALARRTDLGECGRQ